MQETERKQFKVRINATMQVTALVEVTAADKKDALRVAKWCAESPRTAWELSEPGEVQLFLVPEWELARKL